jgi:hypothetical protein
VAGQYTYSVTSGTALAASATQSMWLLDPVTNPVTICEIGVSFNSSSALTSFEVDLYVTTAVGTPAGSTPATVKWMDQNAPGATTTALGPLTSEPSTVSKLCSWYIQPFGGTWTIQYPLQREPGTQSGGTANRLGLRVTTPSGGSASCFSYVVWEEG